MNTDSIHAQTVRDMIHEANTNERSTRITWDGVTILLSRNDWAGGEYVIMVMRNHRDIQPTLRYTGEHADSHAAAYIVALLDHYTPRTLTHTRANVEANDTFEALFR